jgi:hypothetical protein
LKNIAASCEVCARYLGSKHLEKVTVGGYIVKKHEFRSGSWPRLIEKKVVAIEESLSRDISGFPQSTGIALALVDQHFNIRYSLFDIGHSFF